MFQTITEDEKRHLEMISQVIKGLGVTHKEVSPLSNVKTVFAALKDEMMQKVEATTDELEAFKIAMTDGAGGKGFLRKDAFPGKNGKRKSFV